ncbi:MAG: DNA/RNA non-specific endonuclease [Tidjanibacter sp.]|nr:DNA/RNA non-specific endonuclease [Tidjanibacter sp.]
MGFRYGASTTSATWEDVPCTNGSQFSTTLTGLTPATTYYYIAYAVVDDKEVKSTRHQFTTEKGLEVTITSHSCEDLTDDSAYLSASYTATLNSANITPTAAGFYYGVGTTLDNATKITTATSANLTSGSGSYDYWLNGLNPDTKYYWWAWVEVDGEEKKSDRREFTTASKVSTKPVVDAEWLELPAELTGTPCEGAYVWTVKDDTTRNYTIAYNTSEYATYWVAYNLKASHMGSLSRPSSWNYDTTADAPDPNYQVNVDNTYNSYNNGAGHSKGHLIPNASRNGDEEMQKQTFFYPNSVPQIQNGFNGGIWSSLEGALQTIGKQEEIFIVTGTAFSKVGESKSISYTSTKSDSEKQVPIPNYFYKVVLKVNKTNSTVNDAKAIGFWFENKAYEGSYTNYAVSVDQIEKWTGLNFFVNLKNDLEESAESNTSWSEFQSF